MRPASQPFLTAVRIMAALGLFSLSMTGEIEPYYYALGWSCLVFGIIADRKLTQWQPAFRRAETLAVLVMIGNFILDFAFRHQTFFISIAHFLLLFLMFKLPGPKTRKDCLQIFLVAFFQIMASCTLSVDIWQAITLALMIPTATTGLYWHQLEKEQESDPQPLANDARRAYRRMSWSISLAAIPMNLLLAISVFVLFPRLTFNVSIPGFESNVSGYIQQVNLNETGRINVDNTGVLWLSIPDQSERRLWNGYLRGGTLEDFDGRQWRPAHRGFVQTLLPDRNNVFLVSRLPARGKLLRQNILLLDTSDSTLFAQGIPLEVTAHLSSLQRAMDGSLQWNNRSHRPIRYDVISDTELHQEPIEETRLTKLPPIPLEKIRALANQAAGPDLNPLHQAISIENFLRQNYSYSLELGRQAIADPIDDFLFYKRKGPCGYFASAMAIMLRLRGIPCRLVAGYYRGEWNAPAQEYLFRQRDAHAWIEAYIVGRGWVSFDPTPQSAAPENTDQRSWTLSLRQYWNYLELKWNQLVIQYDLYAQLRALEGIQRTSDQASDRLANWWRGRERKRQAIPAVHFKKDFVQSIRRHASVGLFALAAGFIIVSIRRRWMETPSHAVSERVAAYQRFLKKMAREGFPKHASETGLDYVRRMRIERPDKSEQAAHVTKAYYNARFAGLHS